MKENYFEYTIRPIKKFSLQSKELWAYRELILFFIWRDIKVKYKQTFLGILWVLLQPFLMMLIFTYVFTHMLKADTDNIPYPLFAYSGLVLWNFFASSLSGAASSMLTNANIIKKIYFPRLIIPLSAIGSAFIDFMVSSVLLIGLIFYYHFEINWLLFILTFFAGIILTFIAAFGTGVMLSAWNIKYKDFQYLLPFVIQVWFFISPVVYLFHHVNNVVFGILVKLNPMYVAISLFRAAFISVETSWDWILINIVFNLVLFVTGIYIFRRTEYYFADIA